MSEPVKKVPLREGHRAADVVQAIVAAADQPTLEHHLSLRKRLLAEYRALAQSRPLTDDEAAEVTLLGLQRRVVQR